jgi:hypothetical protein
MLFISSKTSSSQRVLGLPIGLLDMGFQLLISKNNNKIIQKHRIHKLENKNTKQTNIQRILKNISPVIRK